MVFINPMSARERIRGPVEADVIRVRDGDSIDVVAHVWPGHDVNISIRLLGIDAPELKGRCKVEKQRALVARDRLIELLAGGSIQLTKISGGKYFGRMLARVRTVEGLDVQQILLREGLVRRYAGRKRQSWCPQRAAKKLN
ncbi:MAG: thermonuclease family protein [Rhizobiaceae bacterium]